MKNRSLSQMLKTATHASALAVTCLCLTSSPAFAAPRGLLANEGKIEFVVKEMGVPVAGSFQRFDAVIDIDPVNPEKSSANVRIDIGSLTTGNDEADALAIGPEWLDKAGAPYAIFKSLAIRETGKGHYEIKGTLSIRNKERPIVIQFSTTEQPGGKTAVNSEFTLKRSEFSIGGGVWNQGGVVAEEIPVKVRFMLAPPGSNAGPSTNRK